VPFVVSFALVRGIFTVKLIAVDSLSCVCAYRMCAVQQDSADPVHFRGAPLDCAGAAKAGNLQPPLSHGISIIES